jgi:hypothetical protein
MIIDQISTPEKVAELGLELAQHHENPEFEKCESMGELLKLNLKVVLKPHVRKLRNF